MESEQIRLIVEGALLASDSPLDIKRLEQLFDDLERPPRDRIKAALQEIEDSCKGRGFILQQTGSGYRFQVRQELARWVNRLWEEKPQRYSRALLETLALIAYRQPATRGDIEEIRGVSVSSNITKTLLEREWVRIVGHRDVPGRPALYATTKQFLDYFNLRSLEELPPLSEIKDIDSLGAGFDLGDAVAEDEAVDNFEADVEVGSADATEAEVSQPKAEEAQVISLADVKAADD